MFELQAREGENLHEIASSCLKFDQVRSSMLVPELCGGPPLWRCWQNSDISEQQTRPPPRGRHEIPENM